MWRMFTALLVAGFLMLAVSLFVWPLNARVHSARLDVGTAAYVLRADVAGALTEGGIVCVLAGVIALIRLRGARARVARARAILPAVPLVVFAVACFAKLVVAVPYILAAYDTAPGFKTMSITIRDYNSYSGIAQAIGVSVFLFLIWPSVALVHRNRRAVAL